MAKRRRETPEEGSDGSCQTDGVSIGQLSGLMGISRAVSADRNDGNGHLRGKKMASPRNRAFLAWLFSVGGFALFLAHIRRGKTFRSVAHGYGSRMTMDHVPGALRPCSSKKVIDKDGDVGGLCSDENRGAKILIHYHKTGTLLAASLVRNLKKRAGIGMKREGGFQRGRRVHDEATKCPVMTVKENFFFKQDAPDLFCDLDDVFPPCTKVLHMVRDPFDLALSNFLYHSQDPTPEEWVNEVFDPCHYSNETLELITPTIGMKRTGLDEVITLCRELSKGKNVPYYDHLTNLDSFDGLRIATAQFIISNHWANGADPIRMANNAVRLHDANAKVLTVDMREWLQNMDGTTVHVLDFLFGDSIPTDTKVEIGESMKGHLNRVSGKNHVTQGKFDEVRDMLAKRLSEDRILGPILQKIKTVLDHC